MPEGTVSDVPCHHAYKLTSTLASTQLSWVNAQAGLSVAQATDVDATLDADANGIFAVGIVG